jgi:hypothetical protein
VTTARWLLAKYNADVERREPQNIGVILFVGELRLARFLAEAKDGRVDGRAVRFIRSAVAYRQWIRHWRRLMSEGDLGPLIEQAQAVSYDQNYYLEPGGELLLGDLPSDPHDLLDDLYTRLVDDTPDTKAEDIGRLSEKVLVPLEMRLPKPIARESLVHVQIGDVVDELRFDYRYNNGVPHLMQRVSLTFGDARSWDRVHATAWTFSQVHHADDQSLKQAQLIALVKPRDEDRSLHRQLLHLERNAHVVDVTHVEEAQQQLLELFGES